MGADVAGQALVALGFQLAVGSRIRDNLLLGIAGVLESHLCHRIHEACGRRKVSRGRTDRRLTGWLARQYQGITAQMRRRIHHERTEATPRDDESFIAQAIKSTLDGHRTHTELCGQILTGWQTRGVASVRSWW